MADSALRWSLENGTRAHIPLAPPTRRALEASEPLEAMRHESGAPTGATCHEPYRGQASMGIIEPYHFVGIGRQGSITLGEQLARFEWMKLHMQNFYSFCDTAQNTHGEKKISSADGPKEGPLCWRTFLTSLHTFLSRYYCTIVPAASRTFGPDKRSTFDKTSHYPIGKAEK